MSKLNTQNYFIYGVHPIRAAIRFSPQRCKKLIIARKDVSMEIINEAKAQKIPIEYSERSTLENRFGISKESQGLVLQCSPPSLYDLDELLALKDLSSILILDSLQDPANLGRIARAAWCFGADALIISKDRSANITPIAEKSAVGAFSIVPVARVTNLLAAIKKLQEIGFFVYGAYEHGNVSINTCDFAKKSAFVIGQEGSGIREPIKNACDMLVKIPMNEGADCLNAADTALLFLYQFKCRLSK